MYIYYFSNYVYKLYWTNNYSVQSDTKYFQPLKGTSKYFYLLFVIIYYTSRAKTQMFRNTTSKPPIGKMMTFPRSRRKAGIRKSNITLSVDINIRFEFMPPGSTVCTGKTSDQRHDCHCVELGLVWMMIFSIYYNYFSLVIRLNIELRLAISGRLTC